MVTIVGLGHFLSVPHYLSKKTQHKQEFHWPHSSPENQFKSMNMPSLTIIILSNFRKRNRSLFVLRTHLTLNHQYFLSSLFQMRERWREMKRERERERERER